MPRQRKLCFKQNTYLPERENKREETYVDVYVCLAPLISIFKLQNLSGCCMIHCTLHRWADRRLGCRGRSELTDTRGARRGLGPAQCTIVEKSPALEAEV